MAPTSTDLQLTRDLATVTARVDDLDRRFASLERRLLLVAFLGSILGGGSVDSIARVRAMIDASAAPTEAAPAE